MGTGPAKSIRALSHKEKDKSPVTPLDLSPERLTERASSATKVLNTFLERLCENIFEFGTGAGRAFRFGSRFSFFLRSHRLKHPSLTEFLYFVALHAWNSVAVALFTDPGAMVSAAIKPAVPIT